MKQMILAYKGLSQVSSVMVRGNVYIVKVDADTMPTQMKQIFAIALEEANGLDIKIERC